ncbi:hypothetical protein L5515_000470 [Caenorhabditis briggsae]|uniref:RNA (guanine-9-)-methyltransferase domain-containing protein 1 n=1 Tax=Caenorhabditis briggsae TaxID=6238 RepID=A0AAE9IXE8_CAEBR|nr:hypothetical protein L3Y34_014387 [Caenorhabditis briggsae]UMM10932.1 hypothetical protein L5515_000470 [Caenorhabditis briggsae]
MEKLSNALQVLEFKARHLLNIPQKFVAPVIWRPSLLTSSHKPSHDFREKLSDEQNCKVDRITEELSLFSRLSSRFPTKLKDSDWKTLIEVKTRKARFEQMMFIYRKEKLEAADLQKKKKIREIKRAEAIEISRNPSFILPKINSISENWIRLRKVIEGFRLQNRPTLAVDCQFLSRLSPRGRGLTALQLQYLISENRSYPDPFRLYFVNYDKDDKKVQELEGNKIQVLKNENTFCPMVSKDGLEIFKERVIIYLSPDASEELESVDDDKIYVIGGIVDRVPEHGIPKHASLEAAQSAGVLVRKLPIDRYVDFKSGSKFLTLLAVSEILRQVNLHGDWKRALEVAIPKRNTRGVEEKNPNGRAALKRIHEFNAEILKRVERKLGKDCY